ncbi:MAG: hypothetical protein GF315_13450 [candidate division Zixibacteria bacterium]|nr:hypothetical protein [candidate division Zixibacteria bacterium]
MNQFREKYDKLRGEDRYLNISALFIFYFPFVLRILYRLRIPHEVVTVTHIALGIFAAVNIWHNQLVTAAILFHFKDIFDACDGALARLTGRGHRIGRFLDTLGDFVSISAVFGVVAYREFAVTGHLFWLILGSMTILSVFIQCSYFNFYQLKYVEFSATRTLLSRTDEGITPDDKKLYKNQTLNVFVLLLQRLYKFIFGWQDYLINRLDQRMVKSISDDKQSDFYQISWYHNKPWMTATSALCFGTHIFTMVICLLLGEPQAALWIISIGFNTYLIALLLYKKCVFSRSKQ